MELIAKMKKIIILTPFVFALIYGCSNDDGSEKVSKSNVPVEKLGGYEVADVLAWAMPDQGPKSTNSLPDFQDYNRFKGLVRDIKASPVGYEGSVVMLAEGKQSLLENIEDDYKWKVFVSGPNAGANSIFFDSKRPIKIEIGPTYLRKHHFDLIVLSCFSDGDTPTNATALYLAQYPGKRPTLLRYQVSTGSAGKMVEYQLHFGPVEWSSVPGARDINYAGKTQKFAECPYAELN